MAIINRYAPAFSFAISLVSHIFEYFSFASSGTPSLPNCKKKRALKRPLLLSTDDGGMYFWQWLSISLMYGPSRERRSCDILCHGNPCLCVPHDYIHEGGILFCDRRSYSVSIQRQLRESFRVLYGIKNYDTTHFQPSSPIPVY